VKYTQPLPGRRHDEGCGRNWFYLQQLVSHDRTITPGAQRIASILRNSCILLDITRLRRAHGE
jgi:hypothetical protein